MVDLTLQNLSPQMVLALGDAALQKGEAKLAQWLYRHVVQAAPGFVGGHARLGLTARPTTRTLAMLEVLQKLEGLRGANAYVGEGIATWMKTPPFIADARFMALAEKDFELAPSGVSNWHWNLTVMLNAARQARDLPGDYVELGVYKGHTTKFLADYLGFASWDRRWWLYDTFEGVPQDQVDAGRKLDAASYGAAFSFEEVRDRFAPYGNITVTKGRVPEVFAEACPDMIAFIHIDLNNAAAEIGALDALYPRLSPGGVIVFDDFCWSTSAAQYKAETEWFQSRGLTVFPLPTGQGLFVKPPV
jgi:hypothetical protein